MRKGREQRPAYAGLFKTSLPEYVDFAVPEEDRSREETEFLNALRVEVNERISTHGLNVVAAVPNVTNEGYRVLVEDREKRRHYVGVTFEEMIRLGEEHGEGGMVRRCIDLVCEKTLEQCAPGYAGSLDEIVRRNVPAERLN